MRSLASKLILGVALSTAVPHPSKAKEWGAEVLLIEDELKMALTRNNFRVANMHYQRLEAMGPKAESSMYHVTHYIGAQAAKALGNIEDYRVRLMRAIASGNEEAAKDLSLFEAQVGMVKWKVKRPCDEDTLSVAPSSFDRALTMRREEVMLSIATTCKWEGYVAAGEYILTEEPLTVQPLSENPETQKTRK
ncbi:hypothetical protein HOD30_05275 [Candidatus Peregrinibacteria bacterium]|nr:hypothetical protein [Candidatus Peregrinibacteria bacterium]MBT4631432.1 hypothetical protein [Candidatus Peregrinibacteria bacterium]